MKFVRGVAAWIYPVRMLLLSLVIQLCAEVQLMVMLLLRRFRKWLRGFVIIEAICTFFEEVVRIGNEEECSCANGRPRRVT